MDARLKLLVLFGLLSLQIALPLSFAWVSLLATIALFAACGLPVAGSALRYRYFFVVAAIPAAFRLALGMGELNDALLNFVFMVSLLFLPVWFARTTPPSDAERALLFFGLPKRWAFAFSIAFASASFFEKKVSKSIAAQRIRGAGRNPMPYAVPVLHSCFRRARRLSLSLSSRGFEA